MVGWRESMYILKEGSNDFDSLDALAICDKK